MVQITKPSDINKIWAESGDRATPLDAKIATGWQVEIPPRQWFNWLDNRQDRAIAHFNQHGIAVWDQLTQYQAGKSYVQGPTSGTIFRCTTTHTNRNPDSTSGFWEVAFLPSNTEVFTEADANARYARLSQNLNDLPNKTTARNNLGVYSTTDADARYAQLSENLNDLPNKATARTNLGVYSTTQVNNLLTAYTQSTDFNRSGTTNGYQMLPGGLILQWGVANVAGDTDAEITFPIAFPSNGFQGVASQGGAFFTGQDAGAGIRNITRTGATLRNGVASPQPIRYIVLGA